MCIEKPTVGDAYRVGAHIYGCREGKTRLRSEENEIKKKKKTKRKNTMNAFQYSCATMCEDNNVHHHNNNRM